MEQMLKALTNMKNWEFVGVTVEFEFPKTREGNGGSKVLRITLGVSQ